MVKLTKEKIEEYKKELKRKISLMQYSFYIKKAVWLIMDDGYYTYYYYPNKVIVVDSNGVCWEASETQVETHIKTLDSFSIDYGWIECDNDQSEYVNGKPKRVFLLENTIKEAINLLEKECINSKQKAKELLEKVLNEFE